ncbi:MAG: DNA-processing protein DprA [Patescibacteria group bacterium]
MDDLSRLGWLSLASFSGFGSRTLRKLRQRFGDDGERAMNASRTELLALRVTDHVADMYLEWRSRIEYQALARRLEAEGIRFVMNTDDEYPSYLLHTSDPPDSLFIRGATLKLRRPVAVVGTRAMSGYGAMAVRHIVGELTRAGCEIISGLAYGIDALAHTVALDSGGTTVAVLAGGVNDDGIYPRGNVQLAERIIRERGTIISELPPGTESFKHLFPLRNRIIAGLSTATIVVEAAESSGSLVTAKLALEENRDVFAVPGPIMSEQSKGTNQLIKLGATPLLCPEDVLGLFDKAGLRHAPPTSVTDDEKTVLQLLNRPLHIDDLIRALEEPPATVMSRLAILELSGCVIHHGAQIYARTLKGKEAAGDEEEAEGE